MDTRVQPGDVILVHLQDEPAFYARVEEILLDRKLGWRQIRFQVLTVPLQELTWILEPSQIDGEPFTMGGNPVRIERLPDPQPIETEGEKSEEEACPGAKIREGKLATTVIAFPPRPKE